MTMKVSDAGLVLASAAQARIAIPALKASKKRRAMLVDMRQSYGMAENPDKSSPRHGTTTP
jgi:hypothetical protein